MRPFTFLLACCSISRSARADLLNLLDDPSVEAATGGTQTSNSAWSLTANSPDGTNPSAEFSESIWAASDGSTGVWFKSFEGNQDTGDPTANASLSQTITVDESGDYVLTFESARETFFTAAAVPAVLSSNGTGGSDQRDLMSSTYNDGGNMASDPTTFTLQLSGVTAGDELTVSVDMIDGIDALSNPQTLMVDNFCLSLLRIDPPPCDAPTVFCASAAGSISLLGTQSISANDTVIEVSGVPETFGLFFMSTNQEPMGFGLICADPAVLCLAPPFARLPFATLAAGGMNSRTLDFTGGGNETAIMAGQTWNFQYWHREPGSQCGFSDAISACFAQ